MGEFGPHPEQMSPIDPEDQKKAEESLEEFREEKRQTILNDKKVERDPSVYHDYAEQKDLNTKHNSRFEKTKRKVEEVIENLKEAMNKPAAKIKIEKKWDNEEEEQK